MQFKALASLFSLVAVVTAASVPTGVPESVPAGVKRALTIIHPGQNDINRTQEHLDFKTYTASDNKLIAQQTKQLWYLAGKGSVTAVIDTYLLGFTWKEDFHVTNGSPEVAKRTITFEEGVAITSGQETTLSVSLSAGFMGVGLSFGAEHKVFSSTEKSRTSSVSTEIPLAANSTTYYYQRDYRFRTQVWFLSDQGGTKAAVVDNNNAVYDKSFNTEIFSVDHAILLEPLKGSSTLGDIQTYTPSANYNLAGLKAMSRIRAYDSLNVAAKTAMGNFTQNL